MLFVVKRKKSKQHFHKDEKKKRTMSTKSLFFRLLHYMFLSLLWICFFCLLCFSLRSIVETACSAREFSSGIGDCLPRRVSRRAKVVLEKEQYKLLHISKGLGDVQVYGIVVCFWFILSLMLVLDYMRFF